MGKSGTGGRFIVQLQRTTTRLTAGFSGLAIDRRQPTTEDRVPPRVPSRFQIEQELGRGGSGAVYRAYDRAAGHVVALKSLHGVSVENRQQLKNEFRALQDIVHPNLVDLYELVMEEQSCFFTMELVNGVDFATYFSTLRRLPIAQGERQKSMVDAACQLALAISALHQGGKLHRDLKPYNVLVTDAGRVVLVDFGLAISTVADAATTTQDSIEGTPLYMSPEQLLGAPLTTASDWYSFGLTLYEAIRGKPLSRLELFGRAPRVETKVSLEHGFDVPETLTGLVDELLSGDPRARPAVGEIFRRLGNRSFVDAPSLSLLPLRDAPELIGRVRELELLRRSLENTGNDSTCVVRVMGASGIGKSTIVRSFLDALATDRRNVLLRSRCHPQETVVFNAIDGLIDDLASEVLDCLDERERVLPNAQHAALTQVFPVLAKVLAADLRADDASPDDRQKRNLAFVGLREILKRLSRRYRIVAWLDDVQWGDQDSGILLRDLLHHRDHPPMMLILSYRSQDENTSPCLQVLREKKDIWGTAVTLRVEALGDEESAALVDGLLPDSWSGDLARKNELVKSAKGSPFLLSELARYLRNPVDKDIDTRDHRIGLDEILRVRTRELPGDCRKILDVLAVAGAPLEQQVTLAAAGVPSGARGFISRLERLSILRTTDIKTQRIEFYHDKMREEVMSQVSPELRAEHHHSIARALLSAAVPNPLAAIDHFDAAGDTESVRRYVIAAANHALKNLAFERAARLYQRAIELDPGEMAPHELQRRLGSALGSAGRGHEAALAYSAAVQLLHVHSEGVAEQSIQLRQKAAEHFIEAGHFAEGIEMLRALTRELDVPFPSSHGNALREAALLRLASLVHGFRLRARHTPSDGRLRRFDVLWAASSRLSMIDYALSSWATARCARDAMLLGEPSRMSRAIGMEASFSALLPQRIFQKRAAKLLAIAEQKALEGDNPEYDSIFTLGARSIISFYGGRFRDTWQQADLAIARLREYSPGRRWEDGPWHMWSLLGLALNGELRELVARMHDLREDAGHRDDRYMDQNTSLGAPAIAWLAIDAVDEAEARANRAIGWAASEYTAQHYMHYVTMVDCALYREDGLAAWQKTLETWAAHKREGFLMLTFLRDDLLRTRGRTALAAALALRKTARRATTSGHTAGQLLAIAMRAVKQMKRHGEGYPLGFALLLESGVACFEGKSDAALASLERALVVFDRADMQLFRETTRFCLGRLRAGSAGRAELMHAERWLIAQGVRNPERLVATLAPGFR